jgi:hypothetical protein
MINTNYAQYQSFGQLTVRPEDLLNSDKQEVKCKIAETSLQAIQKNEVLNMDEVHEN